MLLNLAVYAVLWQKILKRFALTTAYANKGITVVWGVMWGCLVFHEQLTLGRIVGIVCILIGIIMVVTDNE